MAEGSALYRPDDLFKTAHVAPDAIVPEQLAEVHAFKAKLPQMGGLYWTFETPEEFATLLSRLLAALMQELAKGHGATITSLTPTVVEDEAEPEAGLELVEEWTDNLGVATAIMAIFTTHTEAVSAAMILATDQLKILDQTNPESPAILKSTVDEVAGKLEALAIVMDAELPAFERSFRQAAVSSTPFSRVAGRRSWVPPVARCSMVGIVCGKPNRALTPCCSSARSSDLRPENSSRFG